jgi:delta8-fatty-acid desaturase
MLAYRIGRVDGWVNFTPPIRGGKFRTQSEILCQEKVTGHNGEVFSMVVEDVDMDDDDDDDTASSGSSELDVLSSTVSNVSSASSMYDEAISPWKTTSGGQEGLRQRKGPDDAALPQIMQTRTEYVDSAMQEEIDACLKHYPSLDVETQQDITDQFRALHQRVKDEGLYSCRYIEYAKEAVRYTGLFALFLATLCSGEIGWGRTCLSAAFLGLFWVRVRLSLGARR